MAEGSVLSSCDRVWLLSTADLVTIRWLSGVCSWSWAGLLELVDWRNSAKGGRIGLQSYVPEAYWLWLNVGPLQSFYLAAGTS